MSINTSLVNTQKFSNQRPHVSNWSSSVRYIVVLNIWKKTFATHSSFIHLEQIALEKDSCGLEKNIVNVGRRWRTFSA